MKHNAMQYHNNNLEAVIIDWADRQQKGLPFTAQSFVAETGIANQIKVLDLLNNMAIEGKIKRKSELEFQSINPMTIRDHVLQHFIDRYSNISKNQVRVVGVPNRYIEEAFDQLEDEGIIEVNPFNPGTYRKVV